MSGVRKAIITAAGKGTRQYPASTTVQKEMFPLVDRDGLTKPTLQIIAEEAFDAGIEDLAIVVSPGDEDDYRQHFAGITDDLLPSYQGKPWAMEQSEKVRRLESSIHYITQETQDGYGHAVWCAKDWVGDEPVLLLLGDHIYLSDNDERCAAQLIGSFGEDRGLLFGVNPTPVSRVSSFGTLRGRPVPGVERSYEIDRIIEKPTAQTAQESLVTPGLPPDQFLCFFGMYVLTPEVFGALDRNVHDDSRERGEIQLTTALRNVMEQSGARGYHVKGKRYDMGVPFGYVETQIALALYGSRREEIISSLQVILQDTGDEVLARIVSK